MGIKNLIKLIHSYPIPLLEDVEIKKCTVVVDGSELLFHLYFETGQLDFRSGGEYAKFRQIIREFIETLDRCEIKCFVVFDSFKSESNIPRYLETSKEKLERVRQVVDHGTAYCKGPLKPLLGKNVLKQTLYELHVPFVVLPGDADAELAAIANDLDAFVIASDTDFCLFDLKYGFLPFQDFKWRETQQQSGFSCKGKKFCRDMIKETFGTPQRSIAFLAPLLSIQDGIKEVNFIKFFKSLEGEMRARARHLRGTNQERTICIESVLLWLEKYYIDDKQTIRLISSNVSGLPEDRFEKMLGIYNDLPDVETYLTTLRNGGHNSGAGLLCFEDTAGLYRPTSFLPIVPDDQEKPSSHAIDLAIRKAIYQVGFAKKNVSEGTNDWRELKVLETDRIDSWNIPVDVDEEAIRALLVHLEPKEVAERENHSEIKEARESFLLNTLLGSEDRSGLDTLDEENKLLTATLKYWALHQQERCDEVMRALAFTIAAVHSDMETFRLCSSVSHDAFDKKALHAPPSGRFVLQRP